MLDGLTTWYLGALERGGYGLIALLMALESSIVPLPSEVVVPAAAHVAVTRGTLSLPGIVLASTVGSWLGASAMYWLARSLGRALLVRLAPYLLLNAQRIAAAEAWAVGVGPYAVFAARLLPVIRHLIGLPAGLVRLGFLRYSLATVAGAAVWSAVLCWVGVRAGQDAALMHGSLRQLSLWLGGAVLLLGALYYALVHRIMRRARSARGG